MAVIRRRLPPQHQIRRREAELVSLTDNSHTSIIKSQKMIDWATDGMREVEAAGGFNRLQDAKTEFHYQLFKSEQRHYYTAQDMDILDECKTAANVGWLHSIVGVSLSKKHRPSVMHTSILANIEIYRRRTRAHS